MASKIKRILKRPRIWLLLILVIASILAVPSFKPDGVEITYVSTNSPFFGQAKEGAIITELNGASISSLGEYQNAISTIASGDFVAMATTKGPYNAYLEENKTDLGIHVAEPDKISIRFGLELKGGARVVLEPVSTTGERLDLPTIELTKTVLANRLNAYGLSSVEIRSIKDNSGNYLIPISMAGEGSERVVDLVKSVGRFELRIMNSTVLTGDAIIPPIGEPQFDSMTNQYQVTFTITKDAAEQLRTSYIAASPESPTSCSSDTDCSEVFACSRTYGNGICLPRIEMFLDDVEAFSAPPAQTLYQTWKTGDSTQKLVVEAGSLEQATNVKIVLEAGRLPGEIESINIVSQDYVDPKLGSNFLREAALAGIAALFAVLIIVFLRYRRMDIALPIMFTGLSEIVILLGLAVFLRKFWIMDLPAIAGLIVTLGTSVDQQIIITDEILSGQLDKVWSLKRRVKKAFRIIVIAALTTFAAMVPLFGIYELRGFALVTLFGVLVGILVARPAYAKMAEVLLENE